MINQFVGKNFTKFIFAFVGILNFPTFAQPSSHVSEFLFLKRQEGTNWVKSYSNTSGGRLTGCTIEFNAFVHDNFYSKNRLSAISGSYNIYFFPEKNNVKIGLKVVVHDYDYGAVTVKPNPPYFATIKTRDTRKLVSAFNSETISETPGGRFFIYNFDDSFNDVMEEVVQDRLIILFNRQKGGVDIVVPLDLSVISRDDNGLVHKSKDNMNDFFNCLTQSKELFGKSVSR